MTNPEVASRKGIRGNAAVPLLLLLLLLLGAGGYNYHRNVQLEQVDTEPRPFKGYSDEDLDSLANAYQEEIRAFEERYADRKARRVQVRDQGMLSERVHEFERVQRAADRLRGVTTEVADREARLRDIRAEQQKRGGELEGLALHVRRLTTI